VVLVQSDRIESQFFSVAVFVKEIVVVISSLLAVKMLIRDREESMILQHLIIFRDPAIRSFGEIRNFHK